MSTETTTDRDTLDALDFTPELPCEQPDHSKWAGDPPARWIASYRCPRCGHATTYPVCNPDRLDFLTVPIVICGKCDQEAPAEEFHLVFRPIEDAP